MIDPIGSVPPTRRLASAVASPNQLATESRAASRTELPQLVALATELAMQGPPVDYARVAKLRQAIADGSYAIDTRAIAAALVANPGTDAE